MTGEEFGALLGDVISSLEGAMQSIDASVAVLQGINGTIIVPPDSDEQVDPDKPQMTAADLDALIASVENDIDAIAADLSGVSETLQAFNAQSLFEE